MTVNATYNDCAAEVHREMGTDQKHISRITIAIVGKLIQNIVESKIEKDQIEAWSALESFYAIYQKSKKRLGTTPPGPINMTKARGIIQKHFTI